MFLDGERVGRVSEVEHQVSELWRRSAQAGTPVTHACKMNLVVLCGDGESLADTSATVARLSEQHPARVLLLPPPSGTAGIEAHVSAHCHPGPGGKPVCSEQIVLRATGGSEAFLPDAVLRLLVADTPVYTWWRRESLHGDDPLLSPLVARSDRLVVNSSALDRPLEGLTTLARLAADRGWKGNAGDLAWMRTERWRELVASLFDPPGLRRHLDAVTRVTVTTGSPDGSARTTAAGAYLSGWLASRLRWTCESGGRMRRPDGGPVEIVMRHHQNPGFDRIESILIDSEPPGSTSRFEVGRVEPGGPCVKLSVTVEGLGGRPRLHKLAQLDDLVLMHGELQRDARDPIFEEALASAAALL
jgi:glucose-6-phosphate dehydrogenase assembly protein OpcA